MYVVMLKNKKSIALTTESLRLPNWELRIFIIIEEFEDTTVAIRSVSKFYRQIVETATKIDT